MRTRRPTTISGYARTLGVALSLLGARAASAQDAPPIEPPSAPASPPVAPPPAPSPQAFQPAESPLVVPSAPPAAPPSTWVGPAQPAPRYPSSYPPPASYGSYPAQPGYPYAPPPVRAQRPRVGGFEHDGFFLRLNLGVGAGGMRYDERAMPGARPVNVKTRGVTGVFEASVGGRVVDNLIIHGTLIAAGMSSNMTIDGVENRSYDDLATRMALLGGGVTYYLMPANLFFTAVVGGTYLEEEREDERSGYERARIESGLGVGSALSIGKEWWVGQRGQWGIGAAITGAFYTAPIEIVAERTWAKAHSISVSFSATYN